MARPEGIVMASVIKYVIARPDKIVMVSVIKYVIASIIKYVIARPEGPKQSLTIKSSMQAADKKLSW
jgi:hypothetical protein